MEIIQIEKRNDNDEIIQIILKKEKRVSHGHFTTMAAHMYTCMDIKYVRWHRDVQMY